MRQACRLVAALLVFEACTTALGAEQKRGLSIEIRTKQSQIGSAEPLALTLTVTNRGIEAVGGLPSLERSGSVAIYIRRKGSDTWQSAYAPHFFLAHSQGESPSHQKMESIASGSALSVEYWLTFDIGKTAKARSSRYIFSPPGTYEIRATYDTGQGFRLTSNIAVIRSVAYTGTDKAAAEWLLALPQSHFLFERTYNRCVDVTEGRAIAKQIVDRFPESCFYPWARLYLIKYAETSSAGLDKLQGLNAELDRLVELDIPILSADALKQKKAIEKRERRLSPK